MPNDVGNLYVLIGHLSIFFGKVFRSFDHFLTGLSVLFLMSYEFSMYSGYNCLISYMISKYLLPLYGLSFYF